VQIKIAVRHGHLNDETQQRIREKAQKLLHFFERLTMIEVTVDLNHRDEHKDQKHVEFVVQAEHKHDFVAHEVHPDLLAAIDLAVEKIEGQLRRYKEKIQDHRRRPPAGRGAAGAEEPAEE
jgi:putative sigma-54 modulation protein